MLLNKVETPAFLKVLWSVSCHFLYMVYCLWYIISVPFMLVFIIIKWVFVANQGSCVLKVGHIMILIKIYNVGVSFCCLLLNYLLLATTTIRILLLIFKYLPFLHITYYPSDCLLCCSLSQGPWAVFRAEFSCLPVNTRCCFFPLPLCLWWSDCVLKSSNSTLDFLCYLWSFWPWYILF